MKRLPPPKPSKKVRGGYWIKCEKCRNAWKYTGRRIPQPGVVLLVTCSSCGKKTRFTLKAPHK